MKNEKTINRAKQHFIDALLALMEEKPFADITVYELAARAEYDRRTYYRYFKSKEDILILHCSDILGEMADLLIQKGTLTFHSGILSYYEFWQRHLDFLKLLDRNRMLPFLEEQMDLLFYSSVGKAVQKDLPDTLPDVAALGRYSFFFTAGGLWNVLVWWVGEGAVQTPEKLTGYILTSIREFQSMLF